MTTLEQRLKALELRSAPVDGITAIARKFVYPGGLDLEAVRAVFEGHELHREDGETEAAFVERVTAFARERTPAGTIAGFSLHTAKPVVGVDGLPA